MTWTSSPGWRRPTAATLLIAALERAVAFGRFRAHDVRSILAAGTGVARPTAPARRSCWPCPSVPTRPLSDYAIGEGS